MTGIARSILLFCGAMLSTGCTATGDDDGARMTESGTHEPVPGGIDTLGFRSTGLLVYGADGRIVVGDEDAGQLVVFDPDGSEAARIGRRGGGPGEFLLPTGAVAGPDGGLLVIDGRAMRLTVLDRDLRFVEAHPVPGIPLHLVGRLGDEAIVVWLGEGGPTVGTIDLRGGKAATRYRPFERDAELAAAANGPTGRSPWVSAALRGRELLVASTNAYQVHGFGVLDGAPTRTFGRPEVVREPRSPEERADMREQMVRMFQMAGAEPSTYEPSIRQTLAEPKPHFLKDAFATDGAGRLWIATQRGSGATTEIDVFDAEGVLLRTLRVRDRVERMAVSPPHLAVLVQRRTGDAEGAEGVDVYRID